MAVLSVIGTGITTILQRNNEITIEKQKYEYTIYEKALEGKDNITATKVLDFYIKAGLLKGEPGKFIKLLEEGEIDGL